MTTATKTRKRAVRPVLDELPPMPEITAEHIAEMKAAEAKIIEALKKEELVKVYIPKGLSVSDSLIVQISGVRFSYPFGQESEMPASCASLVRARIAQVQKRDAAHLS